MTEKSLKALVVEDQELFRQAVADELTFFGFEAHTAKNGTEGLSMARSTEFDLILSDIRMPSGDGKWLLAELRKTMKASPPFIFMTGFADLALEDAYEMGADGFLGKPLDPDKLAALLAKVCQPLQSRWTEKPALQCDQNISLDLGSWDAETMSGRIALGRGGMFLADDKMVLRTGSHLSFDIKFSDGPLKRLEGIGTVVWRRDQGDGANPGYGIDFAYISPSSLPNWLAFLSAKEIVAVIPKGDIAKGPGKETNMTV